MLLNNNKPTPKWVKDKLDIYTERTQEIKSILDNRKNTDTNEMILDQLIIQNRSIKKQNNMVKNITNITIFYFSITVISLVVGGLILLL